MVFHQHPTLDHKMVSTTTSTPLDQPHDGNVIGDGVSCVPLVDTHGLPRLHNVPCHNVDIIISPKCFDMLHAQTCENSLGHLMFEHPKNLSFYNHRPYAHSIKCKPITTLGIDDKVMVLGICFTCDDLESYPLHVPNAYLSMKCHELALLDMQNYHHISHCVARNMTYNIVLEVPP